MRKVIQNVRLLDPASRTDKICNVLVVNGKIEQITKELIFSADEYIKADSLWLLPGLVDSHVHLREPGQEGKETIATGAQAAAAGGVTSVVCMPNTTPPIDNKTQIEFVIERAQHTGCVRVYPTGALTHDLGGQDLAPIGEMVEAGAVAVSEDMNSIMDSLVLRRAMEYSTIFKIPIILHSEDQTLTQGGVINEGLMSMKLGVWGIPKEAEAAHVARNILLAKKTGAHLHLAHISCAESIDIIRFYKQKGYQFTVEVTPHHLLLTEEATDGYNTNAKMSPPLRTNEDTEALMEGLRDGTINNITSDHAPHTFADKNREFPEAPMGVTGLETLLPLLLDPIKERSGLDELTLLSFVTNRPAAIMNLPGGALYEGGPADFTLWDPEPAETIDAELSYSNSRNTPFHGWQVKGRVERTYCAGKLVYARPRCR